MIFVTIFEIYITNNQLQHTDTIAKAAKVSHYYMAIQSI